MFLLCCASVIMAQESQPTRPPQQTQQAAQPGSPALRDLEVKIAGGWYQPDLDLLYESYTELEQRLGYRPWNSLKVPYFGSLELRYLLRRPHYLVGEVAGSFVARVRDDDHSWVGIWRGGLGYRVDFLSRPVRASAQVSVGMLRANFSRSYRNGEESLNAGESSWYLAASMAGALPVTSRIAIELSAGYLFPPEQKMTIPAADLDLKAPVVSLGIVVELL
jgi:hypothetical protein